MANPPANTGSETTRTSFERTLSREPFTGLKAILGSLSADPGTLCDAVMGAASYEALVAKLGYRFALTKQIHVQDAFSRTGSAGGIRAVLPYYDIPTHRSLPTLVHFDSTVTTTPESAAFFNQLLAALKSQLGADHPGPA